MTLLATRTVRVGIIVEKSGDDWLPFDFRMFHCRSKDKGDRTHCPLSEWAATEIGFLSSSKSLPGLSKLKVGEVARYWVHLRLGHSRDYWGEYDSEIKILKCRRIK